MTQATSAMSDELIKHPEWTDLAQWQLDEIALAVSPISFFSFIDLEAPPDEPANRFATGLAAALSAAGSHVRQTSIPRDAALAPGIELTLDAVPSPAQQAAAMALWNAGLRYRLHFRYGQRRPVITLGLRPDCPLPRFRAEIAPGFVAPPEAPTPRSANATPGPAVPPLPPMSDLMNRFRSLGDNCELGLVQRHVGAEPIDLLRFAGLHIPIEHRLRAVTDAIAKGFAGLGQPGTIHCRLSDPDAHGKQEFLAHESVYQLQYHTNRYAGQVDADRLVQQQAHVLQTWRDKFLSDIRAADKVCIWKSNLPQPENDIRDLLAALTAYGPNTLLWLAECDAEHAPGTVDKVGNGLFKGYMTRFAPYDRAYEIALDSWYAVCARAYQVIPALQRPDRPPPDAPALDAGAYQGWIDGLLGNRLCGWCCRKTSLDPVMLELSIDGRQVATFAAMEHRDDLEQAGIGVGAHGFHSPVAMHDVPPHAVIQIKVQGTDIEIPGSGHPLSDYKRL
jgi:hypothetical protein